MVYLLILPTLRPLFGISSWLNFVVTLLCFLFFSYLQCSDFYPYFKLSYLLSSVSTSLITAHPSLRESLQIDSVRSPSIPRVEACGSNNEGECVSPFKCYLLFFLTVIFNFYHPSLCRSKCFSCSNSKHVLLIVFSDYFECK